MDTYKTYLKLLVYFPLTVALAYFCLRFFLHRFGLSYGMGRRVKVMERIALNSRAYLYVIKVGDEYLLIASTPNGITLLKDMGKNWEDNEPGAEQFDNNVNVPSFESLIGRKFLKIKTKNERQVEDEE